MIIALVLLQLQLACNDSHCCYTVGLKQLVKEKPELLEKISPLIVMHEHTGKSVPTSQPAKAACPNCKGNWKRVNNVLDCTSDARVGCDMTGERKCFACKGVPSIRCTRCKSKGMYKTRSGKKDGRRYTVYAGCTDCGGIGEKGDSWYYGYNRGSYRPGTGYKTCKRCVSGVITCPRCKGKGKYTKRGNCMTCKKGVYPKP